MTAARLRTCGSAARCDASRADDLGRLLARIRSSLPPLRGVVHAAMVLDDAPLERLDRARVREAVEMYQVRDVQAAPAEERTDPSPAT